MSEMERDPELVEDEVQEEVTTHDPLVPVEYDGSAFELGKDDEYWEEGEEDEE